MMTQILNQMPNAYENKVDHIKHLIDTGKEPTLVEVVGHLREKIISLNKDNTLDSKTANNTKALIIKQFKGYCRECGEYGHKKANCVKNSIEYDLLLDKWIIRRYWRIMFLNQW